MTPEVDPVARTPALPWLPLPPWHAEALRVAMGHRAILPHALLVYGLAGIGKHAFALHLALALLCENPTPSGIACGRCPGCTYAVAGQHPDLLRIELATIDAESGEAVRGDLIPIERVRGLIDFVQLTSHRHRAKVAVIAPAERMNLAAANALLKTLEEPPPATYLLLVSSQPGRLPATIASRCRRLALAGPDAATAEAWLATQGVAAPALVLAQAGGAPLAALDLAHPGIQQERKVWLAALVDPERLSPLQLAARVESGHRDERRERLALLVDWLLALTSDLARTLSGGAPVRNPDFGPAIAALAGRVAPVGLFRYHRLVLEHKLLLSHPLQPRLVAESLLVQYHQLFGAGA